MPIDFPQRDPVGAFIEAGDPARALVATDFDGTLSAIVSVPAAARPLPGAAEQLTRLAHLVLAVAVISGRGQADLQRLLPVPGLRLLGDYGRPAPSPDERQALRRFATEATALIAGLPGVALEAKAGSTSVHHRANPAAGPELLSTLAPVAERHGLEARPGRLVVEVLPAGWDKARALAALVEELDPAAVVFSGDDTGDRGCFTYLSTLDRPHLAIGVRSPEAPADLFADCDLVVDGPERNLAVLSRLAGGWARRAPGRAGRAPGG